MLSKGPIFFLGLDVGGGASCWSIPLDATMSQPLGVCGGCPNPPTIVTIEAHINPPPTPWCLVIPMAPCPYYDGWPMYILHAINAYSLPPWSLQV